MSNFTTSISCLLSEQQTVSNSRTKTRQNKPVCQKCDSLFSVQGNIKDESSRAKEDRCSGSPGAISGSATRRSLEQEDVTKHHGVSFTTQFKEGSTLVCGFSCYGNEAHAEGNDNAAMIITSIKK